MSNKISKTIISLIVFVVFFGIAGFIGMNNVHAGKYSTTCVYGWGDEIKFSMHLNSDGGLTEFDLVEGSLISDWDNASIAEKWTGFWTYAMKNTSNLEIRNWGHRYSGFWGWDYFNKTEVNGRKQCPPGAIYVEYFKEHSMILSDGTDKFLQDVETDLAAEEYHCNGAVDCVGGFIVTKFKEKTAGTQHIIEEYALIRQYYYDEPDPANEEVVDDGKEGTDWVNPTVKPIDPLDEDDLKYSCGNGMLTGIPSRLPKFGRFLYNFLQFLVPIALALLGTIDLVKSLSGGKEDDIKKNQMIFVKRLIGAVLIFFSFAIIKLILSIVAEDSAPIIQCADCILRNSTNCKVEG